MIHMKFECVPRFKLGVKSDLGGGVFRFSESLSESRGWRVGVGSDCLDQILNF